MSQGLLSLLRDARKARREGTVAVLTRQRARLAEMVTFARAHSPLFRELYDGLPERIEDPAMLPVTSKKQLMERFDDWVTDREVRIDPVRAFTDDPERIGEYFRGKYTALTTSGTTGTRGTFVLDERTLGVTNALALLMLGAWLGIRDVGRAFLGRGRLAMIMAGGNHFASAVAAARLRGHRGDGLLTLPVDMPLPEMVRLLNAFRPAVLAPYASIGALLAAEQKARRLRIRPVIVVLSAEGLQLTEHDRISVAFHAKVRQGYAATECPFLSYSCERNWLHVNADWVVLEPVEADHTPTPPGRQSHTVLISNLANRVQPILRYDLGDSVLLRPDPCPCGNPLPAIRVQGRAAEALSFPVVHGDPVRIVPMVLVNLAERVSGIEQIQIVQTAPVALRVRLRFAAGVDGDQVWRSLHLAISALLHERGLAHVTVERAYEPPQPSAGGKFREIIPLVG